MCKPYQKLLIFSLTLSENVTVIFSFLSAFLFPPICYMKLKGEGFFRWKYIPLWLLFIFGVAVMVLGTSMAIITQAGNCAFSETQRYWCPGNALQQMHMNNSYTNTTTMPFSSYTSLPTKMRS